MSTSPIRLLIPPSLQRFTCFEHFPFDVRVQVWEDIIYTPGIHFLKFEQNKEALQYTTPDDSDSSTDDDSDGMDRLQLSHTTREGKRVNFTSTLKSAFPSPAADKSYYLTMNKTCTQLSLACSEAAKLVEKLIARRGNLVLDTGRLVHFEQSSDVVCIDYPGATLSRPLGHWADRLDLEQLAKVRRVAIRYSTKWDDECRVCRTCGIIHNFHRHHDNTRPRHAYEFAALFKNLETFYFMDCLAIRKSRDKSKPTSCLHAKKEYGDKGEKFASGEGGRTYYEVDPQFCKINTHVFRALDWVRENYISYCKKYSKGPANPEKVKFKVLSCEWDTEELVPKRQESKPIRSTNKQHKARFSNVNGGSSRIRPKFNPARKSETFDGLPVVFGDDGKSKFEFTVNVPFP